MDEKITYKQPFGKDKYQANSDSPVKLILHQIKKPTDKKPSFNILHHVSKINEIFAI
jgi:hypothetical protein